MKWKLLLTAVFVCGLQLGFRVFCMETFCVVICLSGRYKSWRKSIVNADMKRDILRKTILQLLTKGNVHYTDLDKKVCATCYPFATNNTFKSQLHYLITNGYINRISRGIYEITTKGEKYLTL